MKVLRMRSWNFHADKLDEMTRFYQDALGAELRTQHTVGGVKVNRLRAGETGLGLFDASEKRVTHVPHHTFDIEGPRRSEGIDQRTGCQRNQSGRHAPSRRRPRLLGLRHRPQRESLGAVQRLEQDPAPKIHQTLGPARFAPLGLSWPRPGRRASGLCAEDGHRRRAGRRAERRAAVRSRSAEAAS